MIRPRAVLFSLLGLLLLLGGALAETTLRAGFGAGLDADQASGTPAATSEGTVDRVPGRLGTALVLGPGRGLVSYAVRGNLSLARGTLSVWVQSGGWQGVTAPVPLLAAKDGAAALALWWDPHEAALLLVVTDGTQTTAALKPAYDWTEPAWRHLMLTWGPGQAAVYVDGQPGRSVPQAPPRPPLPSLVDGRLVLGGSLGDRVTVSFRGLSVLSEVLSPERAQERYRVAASGRVTHERPLLRLAPTAQPPTIDGQLTEAEWANAAGTAGFVDLAGGALSTVATSVRLTYDAKHLYLAFRCPTSVPPVARKFDRDAGTPWDDDAVEAWLQPEVGFTGKSFHLIVNAAGSLWDAEDQDAAWNGVAACAVAPGTGEWTAEVAVPHGGLGTLAPSPGTRWQANFCRNLGAGGTANRFTEWAFTGSGGYGVWQMFGALVFQPAGPVARLDAWTAQGTNGEARLVVANPSAKPAKVAARLVGYRQQVAEQSAEVAPAAWDLAAGQSRTETLKLAAPFALDQVVVQVQDAASGQPLLTQMVRAGAVAPSSGAPAGATPAATAPAAPPLTDAKLGAVLRERARWQGNRLGLTEKIPPPWTPMTVAGQTIGCWGRSYDYTGSLFPAQVRSQQQDLLAAPMELVARVGGRAVVFRTAAKQAVSAAPHQVDLEASATAEGLTARVRSHLEYDGCIKLTLTITAAGQPVVVDGLELRIPVKPERSRYYHWFEATRDPRLTNAGALPEAGLKSHFKPLLWLADDDRGLAWFCESPQGWQISDKEATLRVERGAGANVMRVTMADRPFVIATSWQTVFGLMATPTRPMPPGWRNWLIPLNQSNPWGSWQPGFNNLSGTDDPGTLSPQDPAAMRAWVARTQAQGWAVPHYPGTEPTKVIPYSQVVFWSGKHRDGMPSPEITVFGPEWANTSQPPGPRREADNQIPLKEYYWVCPNSSFADFYLYRLNQLIDETGIDGIYLDGSWWFCSNQQHGCGYVDDQGKRQVQFNIWSFRELFKRIYCLFHEKRQDPVVHIHTSCWLAVPALSFCHLMLDGEQYHDAGQKVEDHFQDVVPLDKWRAEHTGRQWGPAPFILPDIPSQYTQGPTATRELLMLTNLHDTAIFPGNLNLRAMMRNYQVRRLFGVAGCEFRGYWGNQDLVRCETPGGLVSVYRQPDGSRCLLVVGNSTKADAELVVRPDLTALKLSAPVSAAVDLETGQTLPLAQGALRVAVKARDYRLIALPAYRPPAITAGDLGATALRALPNPGFEDGLARWATMPIEGNQGTIALDPQTRFAGRASCHLHKADGPGGVMIQTEDVFAVQPGRKYRVNCRLKIANSTGAQAYWMISATDNEGASVLTNNLFAGFLKANQDWQPLPYEFTAPPGAAVVRLHFLVAFPGRMDAWVDDFSFEALP